MEIYQYIGALVRYALERGLIGEWDVIPAHNMVIDVLQCAPKNNADFHWKSNSLPPLGEIMAHIFDYAVSTGVIEDSDTAKDLLDARIMGLLMPRASEVVRIFNNLYTQSPAAATDYFYQISLDANYIQSERIKKNKYWLYKSAYGDFEITINLSKPEKDPKDIAKAKDLPKTGYPQCLLCKENAGFAGHYNHPARQNLRLVPVGLDGENWFFQYSPYSYYNEHSIILSPEHVPMKIDRQTFSRLMAFIDWFPHYSIGSNADLPIVGGSILNHDHYQAGRHEFPMDRATLLRKYTCTAYPGVKAATLYWPLSVIRLESANKDNLIGLSSHILDCWRAYTDEDANIIANTEGTPHNTITPIARKNARENYEMDLVLRNNRTTRDAPYGIFHPNESLHHIKKENIGLIEVLGLAILPGRLDKELEEIAMILEGKKVFKEGGLLNNSHEDWVHQLIHDYGTKNANGSDILRNEVGKAFTLVLEDCGVFKQNDFGASRFEAFLNTVGLKPREEVCL